MSENDFSRFTDPNAKPNPAIPVFFMEPVKLEYRSKTEGRPVFEEQERVKIIIPGDRRSMVVEPVNDDHKTRWPNEYEAFKAGLEAPVDGTPLTEWPQINRGQCEELAYFNIKTLEQLAAVNDAQLQNLGMGARELRERAKLFLEVAAKGTAPLSRLITENERLTGEVLRLTAELTEANTELRLLKKEQANARS